MSLNKLMSSKADKTDPERVLNSKEHTQFRGGVGSLGCPQLSLQLAELRRKQASPTVQDLLKLNKVIRAAKVIEIKIKIGSIPVEHLRFMGVHDAAHASLEGGASQQGHLILAVQCQHHELSRSCVCAELAEQQDQEGCPLQFGCRDMQYVDLPRTSRLDAHNVGTDDPW